MSAPAPAGALVWAGFDGEALPGRLLDGIAQGRIGGLLLLAFRGNVRSSAQVRGMLGEAVAAARRGGFPPVPVAVDQEGGSVIRIGYRAPFPSAMAIGATADPAWAERAATAVARGLRADGIAVNHAPVCDLNSEPRNPVIGIRAFGDDPQRVAAFAAAWVRGSEGAGVAATPKHFPGHGATARDSHHTIVDLVADRATIETRELVPFRAALAAGASGVMTAHVRYPALDPDWIATLSPAILTGLLRGALGFDGLIVTDSLDMSGITRVEAPDAVVVRAIAAGADAVLVTNGSDAQLAAGERIAFGVPAPRVGDALRRMVAFRARFGIPVPADDDGDDDAARALSREIAARSITTLGPPLPDLRGQLRVTTLGPDVPSPVAELATPVEHLEAALRARVGERLRFARDGEVPGGSGPLIVCTWSAAFDPAQTARARTLLAGGGILCALRSPYDAVLAPGLPTLLSYGDVPVSLEALADVLAGRAVARGVLPVRLPA